jgi:hypothetical protein
VGWAHLSAEQQALAASALVKLVYQENPDGWSLCEIATIWGDGLTADELAVLAALEAQEEK